MSLQFKSSGQGDYKGYLISEATIAGVKDISGTKLPFMTKPCDIGVQLILEIGKTFQPTLAISGDFQRDDSGEIIGWGRANKVRELFVKLGAAEGLTEDNRLPPDVLESLIGKKILRLSYVSGRKDNGKLKYSDWSEVGIPEDGAEVLAKRFESSVHRGYPKNFAPELLKEDDSLTSFTGT